VYRTKRHSHSIKPDQCRGREYRYGNRSQPTPRKLYTLYSDDVNGNHSVFDWLCWRVAGDVLLLDVVLNNFISAHLTRLERALAIWLLCLSVCLSNACIATIYEYQHHTINGFSFLRATFYVTSLEVHPEQACSRQVSPPCRKRKFDQ